MADALDFRFYALFGLAFAVMFYAAGPQQVLSGLAVQRGLSSSSAVLFASEQPALTLYNMNKLNIWFAEPDGLDKNLKTFLEKQDKIKPLIEHAKDAVTISYTRKQTASDKGVITIVLDDGKLDVELDCADNKVNATVCEALDSVAQMLVAFLLDETSNDDTTKKLSGYFSSSGSGGVTCTVTAGKSTATSLTVECRKLEGGGSDAGSTGIL
ncbi:hypothetical protein HZC09_03835 [Candidatus Micrarchaeota archaeon]|nr:hypothetical protein [Candidatus Micrarchaeota archaeon]